MADASISFIDEGIASSANGIAARRPSRREALAAAAALPALLAGVLDARATDRFAAEVALFAGTRTLERTGLALESPPVAESGYSVPVTLREAGSGGDPVRRVRLFAPLNPYVRLLTLEVADLGAPLVLSTRIRLARSQTVAALAETAAGRILAAEARIEVVVGGCGFDLPLEPG